MKRRAVIAIVLLATFMVLAVAGYALAHHYGVPAVASFVRTRCEQLRQVSGKPYVDEQGNTVIPSFTVNRPVVIAPFVIEVSYTQYLGRGMAGAYVERYIWCMGKLIQVSRDAEWQT